MIQLVLNDLAVGARNDGQRIVRLEHTFTHKFVSAPGIQIKLKLNSITAEMTATEIHAYVCVATLKRRIC